MPAVVAGSGPHAMLWVRLRPPGRTPRTALDWFSASSSEPGPGAPPAGVPRPQGRSRPARPRMRSFSFCTDVEGPEFVAGDGPWGGTVIGKRFHEDRRAELGRGEAVGVGGGSGGAASAPARPGSLVPAGLGVPIGPRGLGVLPALPVHPCPGGCSRRRGHASVGKAFVGNTIAINGIQVGSGLGLCHCEWPPTVSVSLFSLACGCRRRSWNSSSQGTKER